MPVVSSHAFVAIKQHLLGLLEPVDVVRQFLFVVFEIGDDPLSIKFWLFSSEPVLPSQQQLIR